MSEAGRLSDRVEGGALEDERQRQRKELRTAGRPRWKRRAKQRRLDQLEDVLRRLPDVSDLHRPLVPAGGEEGASAVWWEAAWRELIPESCDPACGGRLCGSKEGKGRTATRREDLTSLSARASRKRQQVESFAIALRSLLGGWGNEQGRFPNCRVVDFGCGTGNLLLPLAALFPCCQFVGVEMKAHAVALLRERIHESELSNVKVVQGMIEHFSEPYDVALALHACGNATDFAMLSAVCQRAAYIICPCCVGKLKFSTTGGSSFSAEHRTWQGIGSDQQRNFASGLAQMLVHPRSQWMLDSFASKGSCCIDDFVLLAQAADFSGESHHACPEQAAQAKTIIEADRNAASAEHGYYTLLSRLQLSAKSSLNVLEPKTELLIGAPMDRPEFGWPWPK